MSRHSASVTLRQMLDHAREAIALTRDHERADLDTDRLLGLGVVRLLEIIGEAAARIPREERDRLPGIPWSQVVGLRNRLIHGYDAIDHDIVWQVLKTDLPPLAEALEHAIAQRNG
jgi:uncharacterized protein with HEPN domain